MSKLEAYVGMGLGLVLGGLALLQAAQDDTFWGITFTVLSAINCLYVFFKMIFIPPLPDTALEIEEII